MSSEPCGDDQPRDDPGTTNPVYAAVARSLTRGAALYFSRPIRLFRPSKSKHPLIYQAIFFFSVIRLASKVSGWQSLRSLAASGGASLNLDFVSQLAKTHGVRLGSSS